MKLKFLTMLLALSVIPVTNAYANDDEYETGQVVISASRIEQQIEDVSANIEVVTAEDIQKMGATSLREVLSMQTGVSVGTGHVSIRGMGTAYTLLLVDGRKVMYSENYGDGASNLWATIANIQDVERIEIIRGAASTMYGSDAMGGVINIITKKGSSQSGSVSTSYNLGSIVNAFNYDSGKIGDFSFKVNASHSKGLGRVTRGYSVDKTTGDVTDGTYSAGNYNDNMILGAGAGYQISENHEVYADISYSRSHTISQTVTNFVGDTVYNSKTHATEDVDSYLTTAGATGTLNTAINAAIEFKGNFGEHMYTFTPRIATFSWLAENSSSTDSAGATTYSTGKDYTFIDIGVDVMDTFALNDWNLLTVGGEYTLGLLNHSVVAMIDKDDDPEADPMHKVGAFVQDEILLLNESLIVLPSIRFDYSNYSTMQFTGRLGTTYEFMPNQRIKFNVGNAFRTPNLNYYAGAETQSLYALVDATGNYWTGSWNKSTRTVNAAVGGTLAYVRDENGVTHYPGSNYYKAVLASFATADPGEDYAGNSLAEVMKDTNNGYSTYSTNGTNQGATYGNPELQPETSVTADMRYEGTLGPIDLAVGGYYTAKFQEISSGEVGLHYIGQVDGAAAYRAMRYRENVDQLTYYRGAELELSYSFADYFNTSLGYSFTNNQAENGGRISGYATHTLNGALNFSYPEWATFASIWGKYMIDYNGTNQYNSDESTTNNYMANTDAYEALGYNYFTLNASIGKTFKEKYTLVLSANDLIQSNKSWYNTNTEEYSLLSGWTAPEYKLTFTAAF